MSGMPSSRQRRPGTGQDAPATWLDLFLLCPVVLCLIAPTTGCGRETPSAGTCPAMARAGLDAGVASDGTGEAACDAAVAATDPAITVPSAARATPPPGECVGTVGEYCALLGGECPTYEESVERRRSLCAHWVVTTSACGRRYRSVSWREPLLGGGEEYFDPGGRLIAAYLYTDYWAYCGGRSFTQTFGRVPTCATKPLEKNLCRRQTPR